MFWIYDLPTWLFFIICISFFIGLTLALQYISRRFIIPYLETDEDREDSLIGSFVGSTGGFYAITVGLIAASVWAKYDGCEEITNKEATCI